MQNMGKHYDEGFWSWFKPLQQFMLLLAFLISTSYSEGVWFVKKNRPQLNG
jgi:hypothetical protein